MKYNEETAQAIIRKFGLSDKTKRVWKTRGSIPDKYKEDFTPRTKSKAGDIRHQRLVDLLQSKTINKKVLAELAGVPAQRLQDAKTIRLSDADLQKCIVEIKRLKIDIAKAFQSYSPLAVKKIFNHRLIAYTKVVQEQGLIDRISYIRKTGQEVDKALYEAVKDKYIVFALTLNI